MGCPHFFTSASVSDALIAWENLALHESRKARFEEEGRGWEKHKEERETNFAERVKEKKQNSSHW